MIAFPAPASLPRGQRVYAIGDVHGCLDELRALHRAVAQDIAARPIASSTLIHLGDYVDRGPDSAGVVRLLLEGPMPAGIGTVVNLTGNHEEMMLTALDERSPATVRHWLMNGGEATLDSYGLREADDPRHWADRLPAGQLAFLRGLALTHRAGGYVFVHAGIRPEIPLCAQVRDDLLWIREPFLSSTASFEAVVVHGHTPVPFPELRRNRIGIDTGAVMGGMLTCAVLERNKVGFLTA
ncbi:MAG TPA: metallophosphoesterase family protein [Acetobacteraceae bacterium]|nr:metallophosphoesterase family protein [Acetobacteraceae bacterium]